MNTPTTPTFFFPWPPTTGNHRNNVRCVNGNPHHYQDKRMKPWHDECALMLRSVIETTKHELHFPLPSFQRLHYYLWLPKDKRRQKSDADNMLKIINDMLVEIGVIEDDAIVWYLPQGEWTASVDHQWPEGRIGIYAISCRELYIPEPDPQEEIARLTAALDRLQRKVSHGCADALCNECDNC